MNAKLDRDALEARLAAAPARKPFARAWLDVAGLPELLDRSGTPLSRAAVEHLLLVQSQHKSMEAAENIWPWLALLAPHANGAFALALTDAWLESAQETSDRFALTLAGLLGDERVVARLLPWIPKWCEGSRHKLAEYAANAIALVHSDQALFALDMLRTRYRSKFRNVGAAAQAAFERAAAARGLSPDELGDLVMPRLGFDADGQRAFEWPGGGARATLGVDWKLHWEALDGERKWKSLPSSAPPESAAAAKELAKELREAAKAQAHRLEGALVRQRRWSPEHFAQSFLLHPLGRTFATRLVCGVFDAHGQLKRTFRRFENGVLADANGADLDWDSVTGSLGFVHPLELSAEELAAWRSHFERNALTPAFAQLDRPIVRRDPAHANRRELALVQGRVVSAGTFRSRAERRGWMRGAVADAGGVASYWKEFPGCGLEVVLELDGMFIGVDPMESVTLGLARFVRAGSVERGAYTYDEPQSDDPRSVSFGQVPPVAWSEALGDLAAIADGAEQL
jgi:hypothetical protein